MRSAWPVLLERLRAETGRKPSESGEGFSACCPAHGDGNPSLSIKMCKDGRILVHCFAGCEVRETMDSLGMSMADLMPDASGDGQMSPSRPEPGHREKRPVPPLDYSHGSDDDHAALACLRHVHIEAVQAAVRRGLVGFGSHRGARCWFVADGTGVNAQARRMDGGLFGEVKALTLKDSWASWPIGIAAVQSHQAIALVEGGPDLLAALSLAWESGMGDHVAPVAMLGAANRIPNEALPYFKGKKVRIFPHLDDPGHKAAATWTNQLIRACAKVRCVSLANIRMENGQFAKDLNDVCSIAVEDFGRDRSRWHLFDFAREGGHV